MLGGLFVVMAVTAWAGGEGFLATMGAIGAFMTFWVGALTVVRG